MTERLAILPAGTTLRGTPTCLTCGSTVGTYRQGERYREHQTPICRQCQAENTLTGRPPRRPTRIHAKALRRARQAA